MTPYFTLMVVAGSTLEMNRHGSSIMAIMAAKATRLVIITVEASRETGTHGTK